MHGEIATEVLAIGSKDQKSRADNVTVASIGAGSVLTGALPNGDLDLEALIYGSSTSALHLAPGVHAFSSDGAPLPDASTATVWHLPVRSGAIEGEWRKGPAVLTAGFRIGGLCASPVVGRSVALSFQPSSGLVQLGPDQAFLGGHDPDGSSDFALVNGDGAIAHLGGPAQFPADAGFTECGEVWLISGDGRFGDWGPQLGFYPAVETLSALSGNACVALDGDQLGAFEIYAAHGADLARFTTSAKVEGHWDLLHLHRGAENASSCAVVWVAHGEVFALTDDAASVIHVVNTTTSADSIERVTPAGSSEAIRSLGQSHALGILAGTDRGHLYQRLGTGAWTLAATAPISADWITETAEGILLSDRTGSVVLLSASGVPCAVVDTGGTIDARPIAQSSGILVVGRSRGDLHGVARWLIAP
jgi:hypothetical protein